MSDARSARDHGIPPHRPPGGMTRLGVWHVADVSGLATVRAVVRDAIAAAVPGGAAARRLTEQTTLLASELTTNALEHGGGPAQVELSADDSSLLLDVADRDQGSGPVLAGQREPGDGGFGLVIALRLAAEVGWYRAAGGKHVWARLSLDA